MRAVAAGMTDPTPATLHASRSSAGTDPGYWFVTSTAPGSLGAHARAMCGLVGIVATGALVATLAPRRWPGRRALGPARAARPPKAGESYGNLWNILPPGSNGNVTALDVASARRHHGDADDAGALRRPARDVRRADQARPGQHHPGRHRPALQARGLHPGDRGEHEVAPSPGVTIQRDAFGVPFITGAPSTTPSTAPATPRSRTGCSSWTCCGTPARPGWPSSSATPPATSRWTRSSSARRTTRRPRRTRRSRRRPPTPVPTGRSCSAASTRSSPASTRPSTTCARSSPRPPARRSTSRCRRCRPTGPAPTSSTSPRWSAASSARAAATRSPTRSGGRRSRRGSARSRR